MSFFISSYAAAAIAYGLLALLLAMSRPQSSQGRWLLVAVTGTALWGLLIAGMVAASGGGLSVLTYWTDALRTLLWTLFLLAVLKQDEGWRSVKRVLSIGAFSLAAAAAVAQALLQDAGGAQGAHLALLGSSVLACLTVEQIFRNSTAEQKQILAPFLWTIAAIFGYELFVFADAVLGKAIDTRLWALRGVFAALAVPLLVLSAKRHPDWVQTLFISRKVVFYSTTLTGVAGYLIAMALVASLIRREGGQWGAIAQFAFSAGALGMLGLALSSARLRAVVRVLITKHFYRNQYEYRDEWLALIRTLSADRDLPLDRRSIKALADIIDSPGGQVWLNKSAAARYEPFASWRAPFPTDVFDAHSALVRFLTEQGWIIDSDEYEQDPERYNHAFGDDLPDLLKNSIVVPLFQQDELLGFARLMRPQGHRALNYEDHDLLKTAGRQVAAFLAHDLAKEELAETRQFEAYNKLSAFVMHDLKNLLSQQALLVENAKKFQHRPEFVADVVKTVDHGVQRMRRLLRQLEQQSPPSHEQRVEVSQLVEQAVVECAESGTVHPSFCGNYRPLWVHAPPDRLASVITHVIVNAQQATKNGSIDVSVTERENKVLIEVRDTGEGMSAEFVHRRLFKPFDTTKGSSGMGIGAYQAREVIRSLGGDIFVSSRIGGGTTVSILLPLAQAPAREVSSSLA